MNMWFKRWLPTLLGTAAIAGALVASQQREPRQLGAWAGAPELNDIAGAVDRSVDMGLTHIDVMVNTYGFTDWAMYDVTKIRALVRAYQAVGIRCSLTTWVRPRPDWIAGLLEFGRLANELGCDITLDLEEPWTVPLKNAARSVVVEWTRQVFANLRASAPNAQIAVTIIVYANLQVLGPALDLCDVIIPQAYATITYTSQMKPGELERIAVKRFEPYGKPIILGQAAWNLVGAYGAKTAREAITMSLRACRALPIAGVRYWRLGWLWSTGEVGSTVRKEFVA